MKAIRLITALMCTASGACFVFSFIKANELAAIVAGAPPGSYEGGRGFALNAPLMMLCYSGAVLAIPSLILLLISAINTQFARKNILIVFSYLTFLPGIVVLLRVSSNIHFIALALAVLLILIIALTLFGLPLRIKKGDGKTTEYKKWKRILFGILWVIFTYNTLSLILVSAMFLTILFPEFDFEENMKLYGNIASIPLFAITALVMYFAWKGQLPGTKRAEQFGRVHA